MARQESDREDLLREATALVERAELDVGPAQPIIVGFRRDGSGSIFFGAEPVYQFNSQNELRRAYAGGQLIKAEVGRLVALDRRRDAHEVVLSRRDLDEEATKQFLGEMQTRLKHLREKLAVGQFKLVGQVPGSAEVVGRIRHWLDSLQEEIVVAKSPKVS